MKYNYVSQCRVCSFFTLAATYLLLICGQVRAQDVPPHDGTPNVMLKDLPASAFQELPFYRAVRLGDVKTIKAMLRKDKKMWINALNIDELRPITYAIIHHQYQAVKLLLEEGADPNRSNGAGASPLVYTVMAKDVPLLNLLLKYGVRVDQRDKYQGTALGVAISLQYVEGVKILLANHADQNTTDDEGWTPLITAASVGNAAITRLLLDAHVRLDARTKQGASALDYARASHFQEVVTSLQRAGAKE